MSVSVHPAAGDCERLGDGFLAQPVNALSSLAYVAVGAELMVRAWRQRSDTWPSIGLGAFGALLTVEGVGSVGFHGPGGGISHRLHDLGIGGTLAFVAATEVVALVRRPRRRARRRLVIGAVLLGAATAINLLSRTGDPLCRPDSLLQGHAAWHVLTALALREWALAAFTDTP
ncbi:MAG TPA: hypothetical protein VF152_02255 [Acidimicrobiia bacterium]